MVAGDADGFDVEVVLFGQLGEFLTAAAEKNLLGAVIDPDGALEAGGESQRGTHLIFVVVVGVEGNHLGLAAGPCWTSAVGAAPVSLLG